MIGMSLNPYQSPAAVDESIIATEEESLATDRIRWAVQLLSVGAFCNLACIEGLLRGVWPRVSWISVVFACWDLIWVAALCAALWRFSPAVLEWSAALLHRLFGGATALDAWLTTYRQSLWPLPFAAGFGLLVWLLWLGCYFVAGMQIGSPLNTLFLVAGNAFGAWVYVNVIAGWVRLRMSDPHSGGSLPPAIGPVSSVNPE